MQAESAALAAMSEVRVERVSDDRVRAHTYGLLGGLLVAPPDAAMLETLACLELPSESEAVFADAWRVLKLAAERANPGDVDDEYQALFIGIGRGEVVPYGSWYMTGFLMDRPLALLRADLSRLGFERQRDVKEPEDHAAALCETMAMLAASDSELDRQRQFFRRHMEPWLKSFFSDLGAAKSAAFYRAVAQFGEQFVDFESRYLTMTV